MSNEHEALKPCPFCDAPARFVGRLERVKCTRPLCGAEGGRFERFSQALTAWNTRATTSPSTDPLREDVRFLAAHVKVNADKLPSPDQARIVCDRILAGLVAPSTDTLKAEEFARRIADEFLPDMATPSLDARHASLKAAILNGVHFGARKALGGSHD